MSRHQPRIVLLWLLVLSLLATVAGLNVGSGGMDLLAGQWLQAGADPAETAMLQQILLDIRLPRTLGAWVAGALLGLAGAVAQGLFRNPLADPFLLGSASGASLGVALALVGIGGNLALAGPTALPGGVMVSMFSGSLWVRLGLTGAAFAGAALAVLLTLVLSRGVQHTLRLWLSGVIVGARCGAAGP